MKFSIFKTFLLSLLMVAQVHFAYAQTASILPPAKTTFVDQNGKPLVKGTVDFYIPSTTTRKTTWQDAAETVPNLNPVVLDAAGRGLILGSGTYRQVVKDRNGNVIWDQNTSSVGSGGGGTSGTGDGDLVGTVKPWAGMVAPNQYLFTYGQELSRTTYAVLLTAITSSQSVFCNSGSPILSGVGDTTNFWIGMPVEVSCLAAGFSTIISKTSSSVTLAANANTTVSATAVFFPWGRGNGTTTFNLPDFRGLTLAGNNNMGGTASANLTATYFGATNPNSIGAAGGNQSASIALALANLPTGITSANAAQAISVASSTVFMQLEPDQAVATSGGSFGYIASSGHRLTVNSAGNNAISVTSNNTSGTPLVIANVPPEKTINYIIKVTPDSASSVSTGVTSLGSMVGDIACTGGLTCTGNNISVNLPITLAQGGTGQVTAPAARASGGLNVDQYTGHGDSIYTILPTDRTVGTNATFTASRTWTLPAANAVNPGQEIVIADFQSTVTATNTLIITRAGSDTINGATSVTMVVANGAYLFKSDGISKWTAQALGAAAAGGVSSVTCGAGLSGGVIVTNGTCAVASGNKVLLNTLTGSGGATLSDTTSFTSTYNDYEIVFDNVLPATTAVQCRLKVNSGGVQSTSYLTVSSGFNTGGSSNTASTTFFPCSINVAQVNNSASGGGVSGRLIMYQAPSTTFRKMMNGTFFHLDSGSSLIDHSINSGYWDGGNGAVTGIEVSFSSGNITSGTVKIYGIVN